MHSTVPLLRDRCPLLWVGLLVFFLISPGNAEERASQNVPAYASVFPVISAPVPGRLNGPGVWLVSLPVEWVVASASWLIAAMALLVTFYLAGSIHQRLDKLVFLCGRMSSASSFSDRTIAPSAKDEQSYWHQENVPLPPDSYAAIHSSQARQQDDGDNIDQLKSELRSLQDQSHEALHLVQRWRELCWTRSVLSDPRLISLIRSFEKEVRPGANNWIASDASQQIMIHSRASEDRELVLAAKRFSEGLIRYLHSQGETWASIWEIADAWAIALSVEIPRLQIRVPRVGSRKDGEWMAFPPGDAPIVDVKSWYVRLGSHFEPALVD